MMELDTAIKNLKSYVTFSKCFKKPIITFTEEIETLLTAYEQVKAERDAAVRDLERMMYHAGGNACDICTGSCHSLPVPCRPEWRGPQQEET